MMPTKNTESLKLDQLNQTSPGKSDMSYLVFCNSTLHPFFCFKSTVSGYLLDFSIPNQWLVTTPPPLTMTKSPGLKLQNQGSASRLCQGGTALQYSEYITLPCIALHSTSLHCNALQCTAIHCNALQCTEMHCNALQCTAMHCNALQCTTLQCTYYFALLYRGTLH